MKRIALLFILALSLPSLALATDYEKLLESVDKEKVIFHSQ